MKARVEDDGQGRRVVRDACLEPCAIERGMRIIGGKWTGSILWHLKDAPVRFNDLARMIGGASKKMITERLRQRLSKTDSYIFHGVVLVDMQVTLSTDR